MSHDIENFLFINDIKVLTMIREWSKFKKLVTSFVDTP